MEELGYEKASDDSYNRTDNVPSWLFIDVLYWTMIDYNASGISLFRTDRLVKSPVNAVNALFSIQVTIRPVITLSKSALESIISESSEQNEVREEINQIDNKNEEANKTDNKREETNKTKKAVVSVPDTYEKMSLSVIIIGFILAVAGIVIYYLTNNKNIKIFKK